MLTLTAPALLWAAPAACVAALLAARRTPREMGRARRAAAAGLRAALVLLLGFALSNPVLTDTEERPYLTVFAADVSESVPAGAWTAALPALKEAWARETAAGGRCALVAFAGRAETLAAPTAAPLEVDAWRLDPRAAAAAAEGNDARLREIEAWRDRLETGATDLAGGLAAARALFREDASNRIVLVTDGRGAAGIELPPGLRVLRLAAPGGRDVAVASVQVPAAVRSGEPFDVRVALHASEAAEISLTLTVDEEAVPEAARKLRVPAGRSLVVLPDVQQKRPLEAGLHRVLVVAGAADDEPRNNSGAAAFSVTGRPRVLLVEGRPGEAELLARVFKAQEIEFVREAPEAAAARAAALEEFAAVVLAGVPRAALAESFVKALSDFVERAGGGLWAVGSSALQGPAGYAKSALEDLLPVRYSPDAAPTASGTPPPPGPTPPTPPAPSPPPPDPPPDPQRVLAPAAAVLFVVDKSGSMAGTPIALVKEACLASAKALTPKDYVGVIAFDRQPRWIVDFTTADRHAEIQERLLRLFADGGTHIFPALVEAYRGFRADGRAWRCAVKHVVLLSDGETLPADFEQVVTAMKADGISVSTICVGASGGFDATLMSRIADWGGGRFFFTNSYRKVQQLFLQETAKVLGAVPRGTPLPPAPAPRDPAPSPAPVPAPAPKPAPTPAAPLAVALKDPHEAVEGVDGASLPPLNGRLDATAKSGAGVSVPLAGSDGKPVLAFGRAGLGKTAAWTADLGGPWSRSWHAWKDTGRLVAQTVRHLSASPPDADLAARALVLAGPSGARVRIDAGEPVELVDVASRRPIPLRAEEDGSWTADVALEKPGELRRLRLARRDGKSAPLGAIRAYEAEFEPPDPARDLFAGQPAAATWESLASAPAGPRSKGERRTDLAPWLALLAALLLPIDVALRRWQP
jgi:Mg-chelatase subunit ChlD